MPMDRNFHSRLMEFEMHRRQHYGLLYFCPSCNRSFLAKDDQGKCIFCQGAVKLVTGASNYIYFCESCDARIESDEPRLTCHACGGKLLTIYKWNMLRPSEKRGIRISRLVRSLHAPDVKIPKIPLPKLRVSASKKEEDFHGEELPSNELLE